MNIEHLEPRIAPATFTVTNLADAGAGSLRDALAQADLRDGADTIVFRLPAPPANSENIIELTGELVSNGNAQIGAVKVGGDWIAGDIVAGVQDGGAPGFGDAGDTVIAGGTISRIASILIKGLVIGSPGFGDHFGFLAQQIGKFKSLGFTAPLTAATDAAIELSPLTGDVTIREV